MNTPAESPPSPIRNLRVSAELEDGTSVTFDVAPSTIPLERATVRVLSAFGHGGAAAHFAETFRDALEGEGLMAAAPAITRAEGAL